MVWAWVRRRLRRMSVRSLLWLAMALIVLAGMAASLLDRWLG
jgi:hypothetical protein